MAREMLEYLVRRDCTVEKEHAAFLQCVEHVIASDVCRIVACDEVCMVDEPWHIEVAFAESQVGDRDTA